MFVRLISTITMETNQLHIPDNPRWHFYNDSDFTYPLLPCHYFLPRMAASRYKAVSMVYKTGFIQIDQKSFVWLRIAFILAGFSISHTSQLFCMGMFDTGHCEARQCGHTFGDQRAKQITIRDKTTGFFYTTGYYRASICAPVNYDLSGNLQPCHPRQQLKQTWLQLVWFKNGSP